MDRFKSVIRHPATRFVALCASGAVLVFLGAWLITAAVSGTGWFASADSEKTEKLRPTPTATSTPLPDLTFVPGGSAEQNFGFFNQVNRAVIAAKPSAKGRDFVDALTAGGFDRSAMQLTADVTYIDLEADTIVFSVQIGTECLLGQYGPASGGYQGIMAPVVEGVGCLVGQTRPIDW